MNLLLRFKARVMKLNYALTTTAAVVAVLYASAAILLYGRVMGQPVQSQDGSLMRMTTGQEIGATRVQVTREQVMRMKLDVPDLEVTDQDGRRLRLYQDLIKDRVVVIGTFYTRCTYVCEGVGRSFADLQKALGRRLGKDVHLILLSRDPEADTPKMLKLWGKKYGVREGWTLLTGDTPTMRKLIAFFASDMLGPVDGHTDRIFIGNDTADAWMISAGLAPPEHLLKLVDSLPVKGKTWTYTKD